MRRVLYLMPNAVAGGAERATLLMLASHDRRRYEPGVVFFTPGPLVEQAAALGVRTHVLGRAMRLRNPLSVAAAIAEIARTTRRDGYAVIHSCMSYAQLVGGPAGSVAGVPTVFYQHGPVGSWMDGAATAVRCDHILANSRFTADAQRAKAWRSRPITVAPCATELQITDQERPRLRAAVNDEHHIPPDASAIGIVARFDPWKGIDVALRAAAPLLRERPGWRFIVVGGQYRQFHDGYGEQLKALASREGVAAQVVFTGYRLDVRPYYARLDALVHSSLQPEPFGLTIIEAMAAGVPVVAARGGGPADIVDEGIDGLLHTPGDETELRADLRRVMDDPSLRASLRAAGLRKVEARYRPAAMMQVIEGVYDTLPGRTS